MYNAISFVPMFTHRLGKFFRVARCVGINVKTAINCIKICLCADSTLRALHLLLTHYKYPYDQLVEVFVYEMKMSGPI